LSTSDTTPLISTVVVVVVVSPFATSTWTDVVVAAWRNGSNKPQRELGPPSGSFLT
jgi:hypothetical protein